MCGAAGADGGVRAVAVDTPVRPFCDLLRDWPGLTKGMNSQHKCVVQQGLMVWYVQWQWIHLCGRFVIC